MRILLFSSSYAPRGGGVETVTRQLARLLTERGHTVEVITNRFPRTLPAHGSIDGVSVHRILFTPLLRTPEARHLTAAQRTRRWLLNLYAPIAFAKLLVGTRRFRPDLVNIHYFSHPSVFMLAAARLLRLPVVLSFHGSDLPSVPYPAVYERHVRIGVRQVSAFTVCSRALGRYLDPLLSPAQRRTVHVALSGVDFDTLASTAPHVPTPYVLMAARLVDKKGVEVAVRAIAHLGHSGNPLHLVVAGEGPLKADLMHLARALDVSSQVHFLGTVDPAQVQALMHRAVCVVVPSLWEAFGVVALEAMAAAVPVVASQTDGLEEIIVDGETGILVPAGDHIALAKAIHSIAQSPGAARAMGRAGRERARFFTWDGMVESYLNAYAAALPVVTGHEQRV